jgi:predicted phosphodiesterase
MPVAALYDIHGNLPALLAVLADAADQGATNFVIGGDVAAGPLPRETIDQLIALGDRARFVRGNADRDIVEAYDRRETDVSRLADPAQRSAVFAAGAISRSHRDFLDSFVPTVALDVDGLGSVLFCHGSPRSDTEIVTAVTPHDRLREILTEVEQPVVVGGHTHQQFDRQVNGWRLINAGSVGIPYEGRQGAYWALLGPDVALRRTEYDVDRALVDLRAEGFPDIAEMFQESLIDPVAPEEAARYFEQQATGQD